jgi:hypothetical protein
MKTIVRIAFWTLVVLVIALAVIGFLHLTRGTVVRHVQAIDAGGEAPAVSEPQFPLT